jgi:lipoprotein signal peptidase
LEKIGELGTLAIASGFLSNSIDALRRGQLISHVYVRVISASNE